MSTIRFLTITFGLSFLISCSNYKKKELKHPNILFAISDDQSFHTSFVGTKFVKTPAFDRIAKEGVFFTNCIAGSPGCAPSRSAIVTGRHHWQNEQSGQHWSSWMKKYVPFIDLLEKKGYSTGYTGKGVDPFMYAQDENDSLLRFNNAAGIAYNKINYVPGTPADERPANGISTVNYFENFKYFIENKKKDEPFFFWYGAREPHRPYEENSWKELDKNLENAEVPPMLPDNETIRADLLDYAVEIEWFDNHLGRMIEYLDQTGELENTIIIVTSDNGMPFLNAKATCYNFGIHVPLAVRYPKKIPGNRIIDDLVGFIDLAPTILDFTHTGIEGMLPITGKSLYKTLTSKKEGLIDKNRKYVYSGRERHSSARHNNLGYPQRAIRSSDFLLIWNAKPNRWPVGSPQKASPNSSDELYPMLGLDENGKYMQNSDASVFTDIAESPTKSFVIENWNNDEIKPFFKRAFLKRPEFEFFDIKVDPFCITNLIDYPEHNDIIQTMKNELFKELENTNDPRVVGPDKEIFDKYTRYSSINKFPEKVKILNY
ncbi:MAG: sulfatase [bacterium]